MRDQLLDLVKQSGSTFEKIRVVGTDAETRFSAGSSDNTFFLRAKWKTSMSDFIGEFGISDLDKLSGCLTFSSFQTDGASISVNRFKKDGVLAPDKINFSDGRETEASVILIPLKNMPAEVTISNIPWEMTWTVERSKIDELSKLTSLFSDVKSIGVKSKGDKLIFDIGAVGSNKTNSAKMAFAENLPSLKGELKFTPAALIAMLKFAGNNPSTMSITSRGVINLSVDTPYGIYDYFLRAKKDD